MNFCIEVICIGDYGTQQRWEGLAVSKDAPTMETLGLTLAEGKELVANVQTKCGRAADNNLSCPAPPLRRVWTETSLSKGQWQSIVHTSFGPVPMPNLALAAFDRDEVSGVPT